MGQHCAEYMGPDFEEAKRNYCDKADGHYCEEANRHALEKGLGHCCEEGLDPGAAVGFPSRSFLRVQSTLKLKNLEGLKNCPGKDS